MNITPIEISQTAASGVWSFNTDRISGGILKQILIKAATATTTFNVKITDRNSNVVYDSDEEGDASTGTLNAKKGIPLLGKYTIAVDTSSADEAFTGRLMVQM